MSNTARYAVALASAKLLRDSAVLDLTQDDFEFLTSTGPYANSKLWLPVDRSRARRCVEASVYGALDMLGYPRFPAPVEYIAAAISTYVDPVNIQTACAVMDGAEFADCIVNGVDQPVRASTIFAHVLMLRSGDDHALVSVERAIDQHPMLKVDESGARRKV